MFIFVISTPPRTVCMFVLGLNYASSLAHPHTRSRDEDAEVVFSVDGWISFSLSELILIKYLPVLDEAELVGGRLDG